LGHTKVPFPESVFAAAAPQTMVFELFGVCGLVVQTVVLRYMLKWLGETRVLTVGLTSALLEMLLVGFLTAKWQVSTAYFTSSLISDY